MEDGGWIARPCGFGVLAEYADSVAASCLEPKFMASCGMMKRFQFLETLPLPAQSHLDIFVSTVASAFSVSKDAARSYYGTVPCLDISGCFARECVTFYDCISWERPFLLKALEYLVAKHYPSDSLQIALALMVRGARECPARRRSSFSTIVNMIKLPDVVGDDDTPAHVLRLRAVCESAIDSAKEAAFDRTFMDPTTLYTTICRDVDIATDADVHGASTYLALLLAATGTRLLRLPVLDDEAKGMGDAMAAGLAKHVEQLWSPASQALPLAAVLRAVQGMSRGPVTGPGRGFIWPISPSRTTKAFASLAVNTSPDNAPMRAQFALYLRKFFSYFTEDALLPRLFTALTAGTCDIDGVSCEGLQQDLQALFVSLRARGDAGIPADCPDAKQWVWDTAAYPPVFNVAAARTLFAALGVLKPAGWVPDAAGTCLLHSPPYTLPAPPVPVVPQGTVMTGGRVRFTAAGDHRRAREYVENLFNASTDKWDKWFHPGHVTSSWVQMDVRAPAVCLTAYGLCSANDCPNRDPTSWTLRGRRYDGTWVVLHTQPAPADFTDRWQWMWFTIDPKLAVVPVISVRLDVHTVRRPGDGMQIGHLHLHYYDSP